MFKHYTAITIELGNYRLALPAYGAAKADHRWASIDIGACSQLHVSEAAIEPLIAALQRCQRDLARIPAGADGAGFNFDDEGEGESSTSWRSTP